jgi:hypothetical protein
MEEDQFKPGDIVTVDYPGIHKGQIAIVRNRIPTHRGNKQKFSVKLLNTPTPIYQKRWASQLILVPDLSNSVMHSGNDIPRRAGTDIPAGRYQAKEHTDTLVPEIKNEKPEKKSFWKRLFG